MYKYSMMIGISDMPINVNGLPTPENVRNTALSKLYPQCNGLDVILNEKPDTEFLFNALSSTVSCDTYTDKFWITENDYNRLRLLNENFEHAVKCKHHNSSDIIEIYSLILNNDSLIINVYVHNS